MTVAAELLTFDSTCPRIGVGMADVARCTRVGMPGAVFATHVSRLVGPWVRSLNPIRIHMALNARRVGSLSIMACRAILNVPLRQLRVQPAATPHTKRDEPRLPMGLRQEI